MKLVPIVHSIHLPQPLYFADLSPTVCQIALAIDHIPAGFPSPAQGYAVNYLDFNQYLISNAAATIAVYCGGDSMVDLGIAKNDLLVIDRSVTPSHRDIVMADVGNEYTIKQLWLGTDGSVELHSANREAAYPPLRFEEGDQLVIVGVVMHVIKRMKASR